jgi:cation:H+ antiporter
MIEYVTSIFNNWIGGITIMIIMSIIIAKACDVFELAADYIGRNMKDGVKGATINAIGSSMPEMLTTVFFLIFYSGSEIAVGFAASVGGDAGSAIFNSIVIPMLVIGMVLFTVVAVKGVKVAKKIILRDGLFLIGAEILLLVLLSSDYITQWHGWVFTIFYVIYLTYTLKSMTKEEMEGESDDEENDEPETWYEKYLFNKKDGKKARAWILLIVGTTFIAIGSAGLVKGTEFIASDWGINPLFVAFILVAAASSIPDTIISLKDARKGNYDDALSNVLGSNIFDITISMGLPLAIYLMITGEPIYFKDVGTTLIDIRIMLLVVTVITMLVFYLSKELKWKQVSILGVLYIFFIIYSLSAGAHLEGVQDNLFADSAGAFLEYLKKPGGVVETLRNIANSITGNWY